MLRPGALDRYVPTLMAGDFVMGVAAAYIGRTVTSPLNASLPPSRPFAELSLVIGALWPAAMYFQDLYSLERAATAYELAGSVLAAVLPLGVLLGLLALAASPTFDVGRRFYLGYLASGAGLLTGWRLIAARLMSGKMSTNVFVAGSGEGARLIGEEVQRRHHLGYTLSGFVVHRGGNGREIREVAIAGVPVRAAASLNEIPVDSTLVLAEPEAVDFPSRDFLQWRVRGGRVIGLESFYEGLTGRVAFSLSQGSWLTEPLGFHHSPWLRRLKRVSDIIAATVLIPAVAPIALLVAVAIKLDSRGSLLYSQDRIGKDGKVFRLYKFRSMCDGAEKDSGAVWASERDARVTRVGAILRRLRIDELPQLVNVFNGDMSLVGPRPERPEMVAEVLREVPLYDYRHAVRPGLTGWAQICCPYAASVEDTREKLCYDLYYIKHWSPTFDIQIALQTIKVVLSGRGSR